MRPRAPWRLLEVDLDQPMRRLDAPEGAAGVIFILRRRGAVLGRLRLLPENLPLEPLELAALAARAIAPTVADWLASGGEAAPAFRPGLDEIRRDALSPDPLAEIDALIAARRRRPDGPSVSIAVCTRRRPDELRGCLAALAGAIAAGREVIVVDNGPDETTRAVASEAGAIYLAEPEPGLSRARNAALARATGEVLAFVDDDVRPEPGWLDPLGASFADPRVAVACGLVLPEALETEAQIAFEEDLGFGGMGLRPLVFDRDFTRAWRAGAPVWEIGAGANMAVRRATALALGGFDPRIGPGAAGGCGDDSEFWRRAIEAGGVAVYEPLSVVRHRHRADAGALAAQARGYGFGHVVALFAQVAAVGDRGDLVRAFATIPAHALRRALKSRINRLRGEADPTLVPWILGHIAGLTKIGLALPRRAAARGSRGGAR